MNKKNPHSDTLFRFLNSIKKSASTVIDFGFSATRRFIENQGFMVASSMAYSTLISLIPFLLFVTIFLNSLNVIDLQLAKELINQNILVPFLPTYQEELLLYADRIIENSTTFGWIGFISFLLSSLLLINKISTSFNWIYNTKPKKNWLIQLTLFLFGLIGFVLILSVVLTITIPTISWVKSNHLLSENNQFISIVSSKITPWVFIFVGLFFMIWKIPASKVHCLSALLGAICGTFSWQLANTIFIYLISRSFNYEKIYGSLAAIVIFFVWIHILWILIYIALEISYIHQYKIFNDASSKIDVTNPYNTIAISVSILEAISRLQEENKNKKGVSLTQIGRNIAVPDLTIHKEIRRLETHQLVIRTKRWPFLYALKSPLKELPASRLIKAIYGFPLEASMKSKGNLWANEILELLEERYKDVKATSIIKM